MIPGFEEHCWKDIIPPEVLKVYEPYQRETYVGGPAALILIDLYNLVFEGGARPVHELVGKHPSTCGEYAHAAIEPIKALIAGARRGGIPVIHVTYDDRPETDHKSMHPTNRPKPAYDPLAYRIREDFKPLPGEQFIYKKRASAFYGTPLVSSLVQLGIRTVIVAGETTSGCVRASAVDSYSEGFHTVVVEECVFDRSIVSHKVNLFDLHHKYADVMKIDEVLAEFPESAQS
jgi:nicotinamidase-related amidase